ncbi:hypothetical protein GIB67_033030 [Kingdonia uniflora]|uniref:Uncharacterized protein n=1 Tax=Kingdonia uniflora TaxID=39325 RepID=A0A7J7MYJ6_9MAGN|nr:hypothetical protein GIB67_033030 [Kingdonia uniflora]
MAASGSAYADVMEIPACVVGTSSSLVRRPRMKKTVPPSKQTSPVQLPSVGTAGVVADLSVAWKSVAEVLKLAAANRAELVRQHDAEKAILQEQLEQEKMLQREQFEKEKVLQREQFEKEVVATKQEVEDEVKKAVDIAVASRNKLIQAFYVYGLSREDVDLALAGKYGEIEVVYLRGKVIEMEKALSRARDSINRTQHVHNKLEYERRLHKSNFDKTFKELFELQCKYGKIKIERDEVLRKEADRFILLQKSLKDKQFVDESDKLECQRSLLSLTLYFEGEVDSERGLKEAYLELLTETNIVPNPARVKFLVQEARNRHSREAQRCSARAGDDRKIHTQLENDLRHVCDELEQCKGHNAYLEAEMVECARLLQNSEKRVTLLEARLLDMEQHLQVSQSRLKKIITPKWGKRAADTDHERQMANVIVFYGSELERVENKFRRYISSCGKDVEVENDKVKNMWLAKRDEGGGASNSKSRPEDSEEEEVEDLLPHTRHKTHPRGRNL